MIIEDTIEFEYDENEGDTLEVSKIENFIKSKGIIPVRFSLLSKDENKIKLSVSGIKQK